MCFGCEIIELTLAQRTTDLLAGPGAWRADIWPGNGEVAGNTAQQRRAAGLGCGSELICERGGARVGA